MSTSITLKLPAAWGQSLGTQPTPVEVAGPHAPAFDAVALDLRLSNAMAAAVFGPRGEGRG